MIFRSSEIDVAGVNGEIEDRDDDVKQRDAEAQSFDDG
jgi:hypothetical protein